MTDPDPFAPASPEKLLAARRSSAISGVQASLYQRLRKRYPAKSGDVAWLLIRASRPETPKHANALSLLRARPSEELEALLEVTRGVAAARSGDPTWKAIASAVVATVELALSGARMREGAAALPRSVVEADVARGRRFEELRAAGSSEAEAGRIALEEFPDVS